MIKQMIAAALAELRRTGVGTARVCSGSVTVSLEITTDRNSRRYDISVKANRATRELVDVVLNNAQIEQLISAAIAAAEEQ